MKRAGQGSAQSLALGVSSSQEQHQHPAVQGVLTWAGQGWELLSERLSCAIRYRGLCVMPAGLRVLCLLPCGRIPSSSYLKTLELHRISDYHIPVKPL